MRFSQQFTPSEPFSPRPSLLPLLPSMPKNGCVVEWTPAVAVCLVHVSPILKEKFTGQKRILHREVENGERVWHP